jgi:uncharacterized protein (DUF736 family)
VAKIGNFNKNPDGSFDGEIVTLSVQARNVRIVPEASGLGGSTPTYRILVGLAEIGSGRANAHDGGREHIALKLDDPSFTAPIYANLFEEAESEKFVLIWSRQTQLERGEPL